MVNTEWKDIDGYKGYYQISNKGEVRSLDRTIKYIDGRVYTYKSQLISLGNDKNGYKACSLYIGSKGKPFKVHRLVMMAFNPHPNQENLCVNHINFKKDDNRTSNLEWCTIKENNIHSLEIRRKYSKEEIESFIDRHLKGESIKSIAINLSITKHQLSSIMKGKVAMYKDMGIKFISEVVIHKNLSDDSIFKILKMWQAGSKRAFIAREMGVDWSTVNNVLKKNINNFKFINKERK